VNDREKLLDNVAKLEDTENLGEFHQFDSFYKTDTGVRLKLRRIDNREQYQLISYERPDSEDAKLSSYFITHLPDAKSAADLHNCLTHSLGIKNEVRKKRLVWIYKSTRIHIDTVENLEEFMELEVVLAPDQTIEAGNQLAAEIMKKLGIESKDLISGAYADHLKN